MDRSVGLTPRCGSGLCGYVNGSGTIVTPPAWKVAKPFSEGLAAACPDEKYLYRWIYIDRTGKTAIEIKYNAQYGYPFHNGMAWVSVLFGFQ